MAHRLFRTFVLVMLTIALLAPSPSRAGDQSEPRPVIAFTSTHDNLNLTPAGDAGEIYLMDRDGTNLQRLTENKFGDGFASLSPDGQEIVFESNRRRIASDPVNTSDLFVMNTRGTGQRFLTRGGSNASWSPDGKQISFHASASGKGRPIRGDPGAATTDSDIFVLNVDDCLDLLEITGDLETGQDPCGSIRKNLTNTNPKFEGEVYAVEDDAEWSPDGKQIVFTSHLSSDHILECPKSPCQTRDTRTSEIYVMNANGTGQPTKLTENTEEERAPSWSRSPDGSQIVFMCRPDRIEENTFRLFQICVMDANGANRRQLTQLTAPLAEERFHGSPVWSPDGTNITFDMSYDMVPMGRLQIWRMPPEVCTDPLDPLDCQTHLTEFKFGVTLFANYGAVRIPEQGQGQVAAGSTDRSAETVLAPAVDDGKADRGKQAEDTTANTKQAKDTTADHGKQAKDTKGTDTKGTKDAKDKKDTTANNKQSENRKDTKETKDTKDTKANNKQGKDTTADHGKQAKDTTGTKDTKAKDTTDSDTAVDRGKQAEDTTVDHGKQVEGTKDADTTVDHGKQGEDTTANNKQAEDTTADHGKQAKDSTDKKDK